MLKTALWLFLAGVGNSDHAWILWRRAGYGPTRYAFEKIARVLWLTSVFKVALHGETDSGPQVAAYALSFVANGVLYGFLGLLLGLVRNLRRS